MPHPHPHRSQKQRVRRPSCCCFFAPSNNPLCFQNFMVANARKLYQSIYRHNHSLSLLQEFFAPVLDNIFLSQLALFEEILTGSSPETNIKITLHGYHWLSNCHMLELIEAVKPNLTFRNCKSRTPLRSQDIKTNATITVNVRVIYFGSKRNLKTRNKEDA